MFLCIAGPKRNCLEASAFCFVKPHRSLRLNPKGTHPRHHASRNDARDVLSVQFEKGIWGDSEK